MLLALSGSLLLWGCSRPEKQKPQAAVPPAPESYEGYYDFTNCNGIMAWAWDRSRPDELLQVDVYDGDTRIATIVAGDFREDLRAAGKGSGKHGFTLITPVKLKDGKPHKIVLRFAGTSQELSNGPRELNCSPG
jgi:hypothetical protein